MIAIGLMSGTSVDGLDIAVVDINGYGVDTNLRLLHFVTVKYPDFLKTKIFKSFYQNITSRFLCSLNFEIGEFYGNSINSFLKKIGIKSTDIAFIASHGQTIYHLMDPNQYEKKSTLQLGDISVICNLTKITTIGDFRTADVAVNGNGAPLVAYPDYLLFKKTGVIRLLQNIGGISNVSVVSEHEDKIFAFDNGPGNVLIDYGMRYLFNKEYDENGSQAFKGKINKEIINYLSDDEYYQKQPPKTTGREKFSKIFFDQLINKFNHISKNDLLTSITFFTALMIANSYKNFVLKQNYKYEIYLSGGGAKNLYILKSLQNLLSSLKVCTIEELGWNLDAKEAIEFVVLGNETYHNMYSNLPNVTNAKRKVILGKIANFYKEENN